MIVGTLGDIVFETSSRYILTFNNFAQTVSARYATHERHATTALTEFTGIDPESITFDIIMSAYLGADPAAQLNVLREYVRSGTAISLVLGTTVYGDYRWVKGGALFAVLWLEQRYLQRNAARISRIIRSDDHDLYSESIA